MFVLAVGLLARAAVGPAERLLTMVGQQRICAVAYAGALAVNLIGCFCAGAKPYGGMGVAAATSAAFVVESALLFWIAKRRLGLHLFVWKPSASCRLRSSASPTKARAFWKASHTTGVCLIQRFTRS